MKDDPARKVTPGGLGRHIRKLRGDARLSQRDIQEMSGGRLSNSYISQLEAGLIDTPSPKILFVLARALGAPYEELMELAGYLDLAKLQVSKDKPKIPGTRSIDNLTVDEEMALLDYLEFVRFKNNSTSKKRKKHRMTSKVL